MRYKLIKQIFIACIAVFLMSFGLMLWVMYDLQSRRSASELADMASYLSAAVDENGWTFLEHTEQETEHRITIVAADGTVLFDNRMAVSEMENHADREEIMEALTDGSGRSERYSHSMQEKTVNYAVLLEDGSVLRVSAAEDTVLHLILSMINPMLAVIILMVVLSVVLASQFSKNIMKPINRMDVENPDDRDLYPEMKPFVRRIMKQNQQIHAQMQELKEEHKKQDTMRREFTANVSHELKTPLTSISGFAEIIRDGMVQEKDIPHFAGNIYNEAQRLIVLVNDILKLSRLEEGNTSMDDRVQVDMLALCQDVAERLQLTAKKANVEVSCTGEPAEISGVRGMLEEIVYNICDNAIKYNRAGGIVDISVKRLDNEVMVRVLDNGIGIPEEDLSRIFERFYRVNKSHSKEVGGTGLGLSIVKHGVAFHNARITLDSEEGRGTEVCLYFPADEAGENKMK